MSARSLQPATPQTTAESGYPTGSAEVRNALALCGEVARQLGQRTITTPGDSVVQQLRGIDTLVDVLEGSSAPDDGFAALNDAEWWNELDQNLMPAVRPDRALLPAMIEQGLASSSLSLRSSTSCHFPTQRSPTPPPQPRFPPTARASLSKEVTPKLRMVHRYELLRACVAEQLLGPTTVATHRRYSLAGIAGESYRYRFWAVFFRGLLSIDSDCQISSTCPSASSSPQNLLASMHSQHGPQASKAA